MLNKRKLPRFYTGILIILVLAVGFMVIQMVQLNPHAQMMGNNPSGMVGMMMGLKSMGKNPVKAGPASIKRGEKLYQTNCSICHGLQGKGDGIAGVALNPRPTNLTKLAGHYPDGMIAAAISKGKGVMPPFKGTIPKKGVWDITNFIQSLRK